MICKSHRNSTQKSGMTLSEVVIAIGIIAFSIPLILAATGGAHRARQDAEADTRSTWLVRDVQHRIMNAWAYPTSSPDLETPFSFPSASTPKVTMELSYKLDGTLLTESINQAVYLVTVDAEPYMAAVNHSSASPLALVSIKIQYPAKASPNNRKKLTYQFVSTPGGIL